MNLGESDTEIEANLIVRLPELCDNRTLKVNGKYVPRTQICVSTETFVPGLPFNVTIRVK